MKENLPNLIIAGAHKAATTSLYTYLADHPDIFGSGKKEINYFAPLRYGEQPEAIEVYKKYFENRKNEKYAVDASPSYMYGGKSIINKMQEILPPHKVIIILRDPVDRFLSNYNWLRAKLYISPDEDLNLFIQKCMAEKKELLKNNDYYGRPIVEGIYIDFVPDWVNTYKENIKIIYFEKLISNPRDVMIDIASWLDIDKAPFTQKKFTAENKTVFVKNKYMHSVALLLNKNFETFFRRNHKLKIKMRELYYKVNREEKSKNSTDDDSKQLLYSIYKEPNLQLAGFLKSKNIKLPIWLN